MGKWKEYFLKVGVMLGYVKGYQEGEALGKAEGQAQGEKDAARILELTRQYGSFQLIPTRLLQELDKLEPHFVQRQLIKNALFAARELAGDVNMGPFVRTGDLIADYLEFDLQDGTPDDEAIKGVFKTPSVFGAILVLAVNRDGFDLNEFLSRIHKDKKLVKRYNENLKNTAHVVK